MQQEKPMPNAIIVAGTAVFTGNSHLHRRKDSEVKDVAAVVGITKGDVEDVVGVVNAQHISYI